jgi:hypothetical protein
VDKEIIEIACCPLLALTKWKKNVGMAENKCNFYYILFMEGSRKEKGWKEEKRQQLKKKRKKNEVDNEKKEKQR